MVAALVAAMAFLGPAPAGAADAGQAPTAEELWQAYPLESSGGRKPVRPNQQATPTPTATPTATATATPASASASREERAPEAVRQRAAVDDGGGAPTVLIGLIVLAAIVAGALVYAHHLGQRVPAARGGGGPDADPASPGALLSYLGDAIAPRSRPPERLWPEEQREASAPASEPTPTPRASEPGVRPPDPGRDWTAESRWQGGDGASRFEIVATTDDGREAVIATSEPIVWPPRVSADVQRLNDEIRRLERALLEAGWTSLPPGDAWYAKRFAWSAAAQAGPGVAEDRDGGEPTAAESESEPAAPADSGDAESGAKAGASRKASMPFGAGLARLGRRPIWPDGAEQLWRCEIEWEAGYKTSRFAAVARSPDGRGERRVAESQPFKWTQAYTPEPEGPLFRPVVRAMVAALEDAGWERVDPGAEWWEQRFLWRREGEPPQRIEPAPVDLEV